jgi:Flp pilus assembly protein TadD
MKGRAQFNSYNGEPTLNTALKYFDEAIAIDANYSAAYANRSKCLVELVGNFARLEEVPRLTREAIEAAQRAVALAPKYADAYSALGFALLYGRLSFTDAREPFGKSRELGWGNASALLEFARFSVFDGAADQAIMASERALVLDPVNLRTHAAHCRVLFSSRHYSDVLAAARKAVSLNPKVSGVYAFLGRALMMLGDIKGGLEASKQETLDWCLATDLAIMNFHLGNKAAAEQAFKELAALEQTHYQQAEVLAQWADAEGALAHLEQAFEQRDVGVVELATDPLLDPIRNHPRWPGFEQRLGYRRKLQLPVA